MFSYNESNSAQERGRVMSEIRPAAVAGLFYPGASRELVPMIEELLAEASGRDLPRSPKAVIAPHAGFIYSGPIAASAFRCFLADAAQIQRIILLGPAHRLPVRGLALAEHEAFETPLGNVPVDREMAEQIRGMTQVSINNPAHAPEHSLEVELPFLQKVLEEFSIVPILISSATADEIAEVLERLWNGPETRIVISSDLSHYLAYEAARRIDRETAQQVVELRGHIDEHRACGAVAINGLLAAARLHALTPRLLDLRNSGDTAGDRMRVVGYGAFAFFEPS